MAAMCYFHDINLTKIIYYSSFYLSLDSSENRDPEEPVADCQHDISGHVWSLPNGEQCSQGVGGDRWSKFQPQQWLRQ